MTLNLSTELREFVEQEIRAGHYPNEGAAVAVADALLRMKEEREHTAWLRAAVQEGIESLDRGEGKPWDVEDTKRRLLERLRAAGKDV
jgi:putative addiction module CopG family antidote